MSLEARLAHSLLMKERQKLIDSGVERSDIVLRRTNLIVKGHVYGTVRGDTFKLASASASLPVTAPISASSSPESVSNSPLVIAPFPISSAPESSTLPSSESATASAASSPSTLSLQGIEVFLWNARSIVNKLKLFQSYIYSKAFDVIALTELGVPVVYLTVKFSPLVIQCTVKIVTQEEEVFYLPFPTVFALGKFDLLLT